MARLTESAVESAALAWPGASASHLARSLGLKPSLLLAKLISGELRVKEAERFLKERGL